MMGFRVDSNHQWATYDYPCFCWNKAESEAKLQNGLSQNMKYIKCLYLHWNADNEKFTQVANKAGFVSDFVIAWSKVMNADWFDLK